MNTNHYSENSAIAQIFNGEEKIIPTAFTNPAGTTSESTKLIRFEEKKERWIWVHPDEINFVKSADHYVKALINLGKQKKWMSRHCTIKDLLGILPPGNFIRLNKFYLLNRNRFTGFSEREKVLFLEDGFSIPVPHCISKYILDLLKK